MPRKTNNDFIREAKPQTAILMRRLSQMLVDYPGTEMRRMFGWNAYFATGNIFCILDSEDATVIIKLTDENLFNEVKKKKGSKVFAPGGTLMKHWIYLPRNISDDEEKLEPYLKEAYAMAKRLKPKTFKTRSRSV